MHISFRLQIARRLARPRADQIFPPLTTDDGTIKYLQPKRSGVRIYFPIGALDAVRHTDHPVYIVEGEKKSLAVAQLGLPAVGICGIDSWHLAASRDLHPDLEVIPLHHRTVELVPDGDWATNPHVNRAVLGLGEALERRGARPRVVVLPKEAAA